MIVKKLRDKRDWSQEQLAIMAGLSTRTIQRIESGNKASLESLKSLASVFEVDVSILKEEIIVIDKSSELWKSESLFVRWLFWGIKERKKLLTMELLVLVLGIGTWIIKPDIFATPAFFLLAYIFSTMKYYIDRQKHW